MRHRLEPTDNLGHSVICTRCKQEFYFESENWVETEEKCLGKDVPVAPPVNLVFEGRRLFMADPATDAQRFEQVCREADSEAKKTGLNIIVFKNKEDNYFTWEEKYMGSINNMEPLYTAQAPVKEEK